MMVVGLTGGIGSGKTTVAKMFHKLNVPIYIADYEAKSLMNRSKVIKRKLKALFGERAYVNETLNRAYLADKIFNNEDLLKQMNAIVHPKVASHFKRWLKKQDAPYVIKEVAILFENGSYKQCDAIITVTSPIEERINRVIKRDNTNKDKVESVMANQWTDEQRFELSDFIITNADLKDTELQVLRVHKELLRMAQ